jgi:hypothetical protein
LVALESIAYAILCVRGHRHSFELLWAERAIKKPVVSPSRLAALSISVSSYHIDQTPVRDFFQAIIYEPRGASKHTRDQ